MVKLFNTEHSHTWTGVMELSLQSPKSNTCPANMNTTCTHSPVQDKVNIKRPVAGGVIASQLGRARANTQHQEKQKFPDPTHHPRPDKAAASFYFGRMVIGGVRCGSAEPAQNSSSPPRPRAGRLRFTRCVFREVSVKCEWVWLWAGGEMTVRRICSPASSPNFRSYYTNFIKCVATQRKHTQFCSTGLHNPHIINTNRIFPPKKRLLLLK